MANGTAVQGAFADQASDGLEARPQPDKTGAINRGLRGFFPSGLGALSMRRDERKSLLVQEWDRWVQTQPINPPAPTARDTLKFFYELQDRRSPLLDFRPSRGDRWQVIHGWLKDEGRVSD